MGDELSPLAYPWRSSLARELDVGSCPGFSVHTGINADGSVRFAFPDSNLEISARRWTYHRGEEEACFSTATLLGAKVSAKGLQNGKLRTSIVLCHVDVGASHHVMASSSFSPRHHGLRPSPVRELSLYELSKDSSVLAPLAVQEHLVWRINSVIEGFNGHRTVTVQNDAWVDSQGNPVATGVGMRPRRVSMVSEPPNNQQQRQPSTSGAAPKWPQLPLRRGIPGVCTGVRPWQFTPHFALADSRLKFTVQGHTLIVSCKTLTDASHLQEDVTRTLILFAFIIAVNLLVMLRSGPRNGNLCQAFPATLIFVVYMMFALARILVRKYLKPQLLVSPHGWLVSYSAFRRPELPHEEGEAYTHVHGPHAQNSSLGTGATGGPMTMVGTVGECTSLKTLSEARGVAQDCASTYAAACVNASICTSERMGSSATVQDAAHVSMQHSTARRGMQGALDMGGAPDAGGMGSARSRSSMHAGHEFETGAESQASSYGVLPASHGATNCAPGASLASLSAPAHGAHAYQMLAGNGILGFPGALGRRMMNGGWVEGAVRTFMEFCGRGESLAAQGAFEGVLGAKVVAPSFPLQPHQATVHLYTATGAHPLTTFLNPSSFWPASNPRDLCFTLQEAETLVATINRHLESLGVRVPLQNDSHVTCMTDLVQQPPRVNLGMHALRSKHALWRIPIFLILAVPLLYFILRIHLTIACLLVLTLACSLYDLIAPAMVLPCNPDSDDAADECNMHASRAQSVSGNSNTTGGVLRHVEDACSIAPGSHSLDVLLPMRQHSHFPCIAHHSKSQQGKRGGLVSEFDTVDPLLPGQVQPPSDWGSRMGLHSRNSRGFRGTSRPQGPSHKDLMVCQRAEITARNYMRRVQGRKLWESARMHSLAATLSYPLQDQLAVHSAYACGASAAPVMAPQRPLQNLVAFPFPSSFGAESGDFFFPPLSSYRSTGAELLTAASGEFIVRRVPSDSGIVAHASLRGDLLASAPPLLPHSLPRTNCMPPFPPPSPILHTCASTGQLYNAHVNLPTSTSTGALNRMVSGNSGWGGSEYSPSASAAAARPAAPWLPHSRSTSHLSLSRGGRLPMHASPSTGHLQLTGSSNCPDREDPAPPNAGVSENPAPDSTSGGGGGATSSSVSIVPQLGAQACAGAHRSTTLENTPHMPRPASGSSQGLPTCLSALSSPTPSPLMCGTLSSPPAPVETPLTQPPLRDPPPSASVDSPLAPSPTPPKPPHEHTINRASDGSGVGGAATYSAAPPTPPVDTRQQVLEASGYSNVDLSTEVRVLCRAKGCVRLAFPTRPYVHFSVFISTLLWASTLGLCILALSSRIKWKESWFLRLLGYESRSLGACLCVVLAFWVLLAARMLFPEQDTMVVDVEGVPADINHYVSKPHPSVSEGLSGLGGAASSGGNERDAAAAAAPHMHGRWSVSKMPRWWPEALSEDAINGGGFEGGSRRWQGWLRWFAVTGLVTDAPIASLLGCQVHVAQQVSPTAGQATCLLLHYSPPEPRQRNTPSPQQEQPEQHQTTDGSVSAPLLRTSTNASSDNHRINSVAATANGSDCCHSRSRRDSRTLRLTDSTNSHFLGVPGWLSIYDKLLIADLINACIAEVDGRDNGAGRATGGHGEGLPVTKVNLDSQEAAHRHSSGSGCIDMNADFLSCGGAAGQQVEVGYNSQQTRSAPRPIEGGLGRVSAAGSVSVGVRSRDMHAPHDSFGTLSSSALPLPSAAPSMASSSVPVPPLKISLPGAAPHSLSGVPETSQAEQSNSALQAFVLPCISAIYSDTTRTSSEGVSTRSLPEVTTGASTGALPGNAQEESVVQDPRTFAVAISTHAYNRTTEEASLVGGPSTRAVPPVPTCNANAREAPSPWAVPLSSYRIVPEASADLGAESSRAFTVTDHLLSYRVVGDATSCSMDAPSVASDDTFC